MMEQAASKYPPIIEGVQVKKFFKVQKVSSSQKKEQLQLKGE